MKVKSVILSIAVLILAAGFASADNDLELGVHQAKAAYESNPNPQTAAALDAAVAALEAAAQEPVGAQPNAAVVETEPNDSAATASSLGSVDYGQGATSPAGDIDWWTNSYTALVDDLAFAYVDTTGSAALDSQLNVYADDGTTLIEFDDDDGPSLSSCAAGGVVPQAGAVYFRVNEYQDNGVIDPYLICAGSLRAQDTEEEPNDAWDEANAYDFTIMNGNSASGDIDYYSFDATAGDLLAVILDEDPTGGGAMDSDIFIYDTDGTTVLATGDNNSWNDDNCAGNATAAPTSGTYYVSVTNGGVSGGDYRFVICAHGRIPVELQSFSAE